MWTRPRQRANGEPFGLPATICLPIDRNTIPWGGVPASIPDRAQRLYADPLEPERPIGDRALLVYPGEIFRFHFPEALDEPNCIPTAGAMQWVLPIGDVACAFPEVDETGVVSAASPAATDWKSEPREALEKDGAPLALHATALACDLPRAKSVVRYIHVSALLAGTPESLALSDSANTVLGALCSAPGTECSTDSLAKALEGLLDAREELGAYAHIES